MVIIQSSIFGHRGCIFSHLPKLILCYSTLTPQFLPNSYHGENELAKRQNNEQSVVFCNSQITKLGRIGNIREAESLFERMPVKNTITWTALLTVYAENGQLENARKVFDEMPQRNIASWNAMITGLVRNGLRIAEAYELFNRIPERNAVSYAAMITGFARAAMFDEAERLYNGMRSNWRDPVCSNALICGYLKFGKLDDAARVFTGMAEKDVVSWSSMVDGYCKNGMINDARQLFESMPKRNVVSWTVMIDGYMNNGNFKEGFLLFLSMRREGVVSVNPLTLTTIIEACANQVKAREGCQIHGLVSRMGFHDLILSNSIVNMYGKFGCLDAANRLFHLMSKRDTVSWNSLIASHVQAGKVEEAYVLFQMMPKRDIVSWTTMMGGFSGKGDVAKSITLFNLMPEKDDVAWTAVISGLVNCEKYAEAIQWYILMTQRSVRPNLLTMSSVICAAAGLATLFHGVLSACTHMGLVEEGQDNFKSMKSAYDIEPGPDHYACMIDLLGRAGLLDQAVDMIRAMPFEPHVGVWGALLSASQLHLRPDIAQLASDQLLKLEPDNATPLVVLSNIYSTIDGKDVEEVRLTLKSKGIAKSPGCSWIVVRDKTR